MLLEMRAKPALVAATVLLLALACGAGDRERTEVYRYPSTQQIELSRSAEPPPPPPPSYEERLAQIPSGATEQEALEALLLSYCGDCHATTFDTRVDGSGMYYVDDIDRLIERGKIIPGDAAGSKLVLRMLRGEMPPVSSGLPAPAPELIQWLSDFISRLPAEPTR